VGAGPETEKIFEEQVKIAWTITTNKNATDPISLQGK
jgi:hypothetical protein